MSLIDTFTTKLADKIGLNTRNLRRAPVGFDINEFRSNILGESGLLKTNLFLVTIQFPAEFAQTQTQLMRITPRTLMMFTDQVSLPGISLGSEDQVRRYGTGVAEKMPFGVLFTDLSVNFLADGRGEILKMFHNWMKYIVNFDSRRNNNTGFNGADPYEVAYKDEYAAVMTIDVFNEGGDKIITYTLNDVYPLFLGEVGLSWADNDNIMKLPVTFTYSDWQTDSMQITSPSPGASNRLNTLQKILKIGTVIQTISSLKKPQNIGDAVNVLNNANILF
jgi:hypothetical protein